MAGLPMEKVQCEEELPLFVQRRPYETASLSCPSSSDLKPIELYQHLHENIVLEDSIIHSVPAVVSYHFCKVW